MFCKSNLFFVANPNPDGPIHKLFPFKLSVIQWLLILISLLIALANTGCSKGPPFIIDLMPAPDVYADGSIDPFMNLDSTMQTLDQDMLYCTDRKPDDDDPRAYLNERGFYLRLGHARIALGEGTITWEEARRISLLKNRTEKYPLKAKEIHEIGILDRTFTVFTPEKLIPPDPQSAAREFAERINEKLAISDHKDIYIYVHGYKVVFVNPILVASELWHFLGYEGVFIAFSWPSTPKTLAYASDLETASISAHNLRILLEFLGEETDAEQIHIIGYSAGTRLVAKALAQLTFIHHDDDRATVQRLRRIGRVVLVASDMDREQLMAYIVEGLMKVPKTLSIYLSTTDKALGFSDWLFRRKRLGQMWEESLTPKSIKFLNNTPELQFIDVTDVEGSDDGNGHAYFRTSPWVSSDILMALKYDLEPDERGLVRSLDEPIWIFPENYIDRLKETLTKNRPS